MTTSFYSFLIGSLIAFLPAYWDHGKTWREVKKDGQKNKTRSIVKLLVLWTIPISGLFGTVFLGIENVKSDAEMAGLSNDLAQAKTRLQDRIIKPVDRQGFISILHNAPKFKLSLYTTATDRETLKFKDQLQNMLEAAQYTITNSHSSVPINHPVFNGMNDVSNTEATVFLCIPKTNTTDVVLTLPRDGGIMKMRDALKTIGIDTYVMSLNEFEQNESPAQLEPWGLVILVTEKR